EQGARGHAAMIPLDSPIRVLPSQITAHHLRTVAGSTYVRGEAYWREGRVVSCVADENSIEGTVTGSSHYRVRVVSAGHALDASRVMHLAAENVRVGVDEESRRGACPDAQLGPLWTRLVELREVIRRSAYPRSRGVRESGSWSFDERAAAITWKEPARIFRQATYSTTALLTKLAFPGGGAAELTCSCDARDAHCTHSVALIDA